ncbi:MAG: Ig-like domain-containing protein [Phycisphaerae bacterium]|nr:Ig-like domain-containing protein [Gemmatimonadaceae bacterium]
MMKGLRFPLALAAVGYLFSADAEPLRVLRVSPGAEAGATDTIVITFDRPVAGSLDNAVDPRTIVQIEPAVPQALIDWRDPVTLRIIPRPALRRGVTYTVSVATGFRAMDGSQLASSYRTTFRVRGPTLLSGTPVGARDTADNLDASPKFTLRYDVPVRPVDVAALTRVEASPRCVRGTTRVGNVPVSPVGNSTAPVREITLQTSTALPLDCFATLVAPRELEEGAATPIARTSVRWPFRVHGAFNIAGAECGQEGYCPTGGISLRFSTPVSGKELARVLRIAPAAALSFDTTETATDWEIDATLKPRLTYAVFMASPIRDAFGQPLTGNPAVSFRTTGYEPDVQVPYGRLMIERGAFRTLAVRTMNIDTLIVETLAVPASLEPVVINQGSWEWKNAWDSLPQLRTVRRIPVKKAVDQGRIVAIPMPVGNAQQGNSTTMVLVQIRDAAAAKDTTEEGAYGAPPISMVQVTNLGVHARIGDASGAVWVTGANDGKPRAGAQVVLHDVKGSVLARGTSDAQGLAQLANFTWLKPGNDEDDNGEGYVAVTLGEDRALLAVRDGDPDLAPWRFDLNSAWGNNRAPLAGALFTERGIYRPGEQVYAKAIMRQGALGALNAPAARDTVRWIMRDREYAERETAKGALSEFGTVDRAFTIPADAPLGDYTLDLQWLHRGKWTTVAATSYKVAEFRPPEFLVDIAALSSAKYPGDSVSARVTARYLFGAPMAGAALAWEVRRTTLTPDELGIPGTDGWQVGDSDNGWDRTESRGPRTDLLASGSDSLDRTGQRVVGTVAKLAEDGRPARMTLVATVTDVNRRTVGSTTTSIVHPADVYVAAKPDGDSWFWSVGAPRSLQILAMRPTGEHVAGTRVDGVLVRREWHRVRRTRDGITEEVGEWVSDTVARCAVTSAEASRPCSFTPTAAGVHSVVLRARDASGRATVTSFTRWVTGPGWVPYNDDGEFKLEVIADKKRYAPGDTATLVFASPFTDAEAWITVEREGLFEQRRLRLTSGTTTFKLPITEAHAPNVFVSMLVTRGRSTPPGTLGDPGRPTVRVGYAELRVTPEVKRLSVSVVPNQNEYRPGDTTRVMLDVKNARNQGVKSEVTLWAVDEGVLALTGYRTPDPLDLLYQPRGVGLTLASTLVSVAPQLPEGEKGFREAGGSGGRDGGDILRSQFRTTAFFLGSVVTDDAGHAVATAKLPDNLTTFRVMAVAVTRADRFGSGFGKLLVTRPLVARAALPRFLRPGDAAEAGTVVNLRGGNKASASVDVSVQGATISGKNSQNITLEAGRGREVRFPIRAVPGKQAVFRFDVKSGKERDALQTTIPIRPDSRPTYSATGGTFANAGALMLPMGAPLDGPLDYSRSELTLYIGSSPLAVVRAAAARARSYPYQCTEQISSTALPLVALLNADRANAAAQEANLSLRLAPATAAGDVAAAISALTRRQRSDGGIGYWGAGDWTTPWLSAQAAMVFAEARDAGIAVNDSTVARLVAYLQQAAGKPITAQSPTTGFTPVAQFYDKRGAILAEYVAAVDALSRLGRANVAVENELVRRAAQLAWEDRARLARVLARRNAMAPARALLTPLWATVKVEGRHAVLPDSALGASYFASQARPAALLLSATMAVQPEHPLVAPLVETLITAGRRNSDLFGETQDLSSSVQALADVERRQRGAARRGVRVTVNGRTLLEVPTGRQAQDTTLSLAAFANASSRTDSLRVEIAPLATGPALYAVASLSAIAKTRPTTPVDRGFSLEHWIEGAEDRKPVTTVSAGALVRVWVRVTVTAERRFVVVDDPLPAGLEAVDLSLRTAPLASGTARPLSTPSSEEAFMRQDDDNPLGRWGFGRWDSGWWSPFDHQELRDDRVLWSATVLWPGRYTVSYLARASTPGTFVRPPAYAEEMYDRAVFGRSDGGVFTITPPR